MYCFRQESIFSLEQLLEMSPNEKYAWIFETLDITPESNNQKGKFRLARNA
jgi:hypothetical protein